MTEQDWLASEDPAVMLAYLDRRHPETAHVPIIGLSDRKLRLFACACCRQVWHLLTDERSRKAVEFMEGWDDSLAMLSAEEREAEEPEDSPRQRACVGAMRAQMDMRTNETAHAADAAWAVIGHREASAAATAVLYQLSPLQAMPDNLAAQSALLREVVGNPFAAMKRPPASADVLALADHIYQTRDLTAYPVLRDALLDAGCDEDRVLSHCLESGHVRGCWLIDLLLGKN